MAFKIAASMAFKAAMEKAGAVLMEPIMKIEVITPSDYLGDVIGDLNSRRAQIQAMEPRGEVQEVRAFIPLAETFQYATQLRSLTTGRASFSMELDHYEAVPQHVAQQIVGKK
jgi:elongation factor G